MEITAQKREIFGKKVNQLRKQDLVPAELYGRGIENLHLSVPRKELASLYEDAGENTLINVVLADEKNDKRPVMIHHVSHDPVTDNITSVDFYQVRLDEAVTVHVPCEFINSSAAVKDHGGVLVKSLQEIEVEALPHKVPHSIEVDLSRLESIGDSIHLKDLSISEDAKVFLAGDTVVASVIEKVAEEEEAPADIDVSAVKTEAEAKKEEKGVQEEDEEAKE